MGGAATSIHYGVYGALEIFFIGRDGRIAFKEIGPPSFGLLTDEIERLLSANEGRKTGAR